MTHDSYVLLVKTADQAIQHHLSCAAMKQTSNAERITYTSAARNLANALIDLTILFDYQPIKES